MTTKIIPVRAPFHCAEWLAPVCDRCLASAGRAIGSRELVRPLWSCVDGMPLHTADVDLQAYLIRALAVEPVDWPRALRAVHAAAQQPVMLVDFGPGGGSGAMRVSAVIAAEQAWEHSL
eukprot:2888488-Prymnesium_polylepis.1